MSVIKSWTLAVCMACIVAGILQQFVGERTKYSVIKLVLTLYILITAFAPLNSINISKINFLPESKAQVASTNTDELVLSAVQTNLEQKVIGACKAQSLDFESIKITVSEQSGVIGITKIVLTPNANSDVEQIKNVVLNTLETNILIEVNNEE